MRFLAFPVYSSCITVSLYHLRSLAVPDVYSMIYSMFVLEFHLSTVSVLYSIYATFAIGEHQTYSGNHFMMLAWQYCVKIVCITWDSWLSLSILWSVRASFSKALAVCITWDPWLSLMSILWSILCSFLNSEFHLSTVYVTQCYTVYTQPL